MTCFAASPLRRIAEAVAVSPPLLITPPVGGDDSSFEDELLDKVIHSPRHTLASKAATVAAALGVAGFGLTFGYNVVVPVREAYEKGSKGDADDGGSSASH